MTEPYYFILSKWINKTLSLGTYWKRTVSDIVTIKKGKVTLPTLEGCHGSLINLLGYVSIQSRGPFCLSHRQLDWQSVWSLYLLLGSKGPILTKSKFFRGRGLLSSLRIKESKAPGLRAYCSIRLQRAFHLLSNQGRESFVVIKHSKFTSVFILDNLTASYNSWRKLKMDYIS